MTRWVAALAGVAALAAAILAPWQPTGYTHTTKSISYPRGEWVDVCRTPVPGRGTIHLGTQLPIRARTVPRFVHVRFVRLPAEDGTGDIRINPSHRRWTLTHWHTVRGYRGHMTVRVFVSGHGRWHAPWTICKAYR